MDGAPLDHHIALPAHLLGPVVEGTNDLALEHHAKVQADGPVHGRRGPWREVDGARRRPDGVANGDGATVRLLPGALEGSGKLGGAEEVDEADVLGGVRWRDHLGGGGEGVVGLVGGGPGEGGEVAVVVEDGGAGGGVAGYDAPDGGEGGERHIFFEKGRVDGGGGSAFGVLATMSCAGWNSLVVAASCVCVHSDAAQDARSPYSGVIY